jgi:hypothetical protein
VTCVEDQLLGRLAVVVLPELDEAEHFVGLFAFADIGEGLALFSGLNVSLKKSFLSEYSSRITPQKVSSLLGLWQARLTGEASFAVI